MTDLADQLSKELPYLRRYARALTGSQQLGDDYAYETLETVMKDRGAISPGFPLRVSLYKIFHERWVLGGRGAADDKSDSINAHAQSLISSLAPDSREALLLATIEECTRPQLSHILGLDEGVIEDLLKTASADMLRGAAGAILIIEDEAIIAADLTSIVEQVGHKVIGVARTRDEAVQLGKSELPALILADIQLADGSSGIDATLDLLAEFGGIPVIFITAFPERLLTGERPEPAFLISKPYTTEHVTSAVSQAMFFASTETLANIQT